MNSIFDGVTQALLKRYSSAIQALLKRYQALLKRYSSATQALLKRYSSVTQALLKRYASVMQKAITTEEWETPSHLAQQIVRRHALNKLRVLEPCAGSGQIAQYLPTGSLCIEIQPDRVRAGRVKAPQCVWITRDFLAIPDGDLEFDVVVANPPFSAALEFISKSASFLADDYEARLLFLLPLDFFCTLKRNQWLMDSQLVRIHEITLIVGRVAFLGSDGQPVRGRQVSDALFDLRVGRTLSTEFLRS